LFIERGKTKSRMVPGPSFNIKWTRLPPGPPGVVSEVKDVSINGTQITESDGNRWPPPKGDDISDFGSEFFTRKTEVLPIRLPHTSLYFKPVVGQLTYPYRLDGEFMIANAWGTAGQTFADTRNSRYLAPQFPDLSSSRSALVTKGAIAVAATAPTNQIANAASSVGELLQDLPAIPGAALWKSRLHALEILGAGAGEFLNGVFGVLPTFSDMSTFYKGVHNIDKRVDQFIRDSGRIVRRSFYFPKEVSVTEEVVPGYSPVGCSFNSNNLYASISRALPVYETIRRRTVEREIWFSGAFTYHLPDSFDRDDRADRIKLMAELLGAKPDLNTLWQLTPWSWAVDWFTNAGAFVKNAQTLINYGTILRYGYVMETCTVTDTYMAGVQNSGTPWPEYAPAISPPYPRPADVTLRVTSKKRIKANPFGFGISWDGLSTTQKAIAAALGITRVVR